jgi:hypothetical protein
MVRASSTISEFCYKEWSIGEAVHAFEASMIDNSMWNRLITRRL